jgi:transcriptional regulator with XRE-family HTH domain
MENLAAKLRSYRKANGMTQAELAEKLGMGQKNISNYEKGLNPTPAAYKKIIELVGEGRADPPTLAAPRKMEELRSDPVVQVLQECAKLQGKLEESQRVTDKFFTEIRDVLDKAKGVIEQPKPKAHDHIVRVRSPTRPKIGVGGRA